MRRPRRSVDGQICTRRSTYLLRLAEADLPGQRPPSRRTCRGAPACGASRRGPAVARTVRADLWKPPDVEPPSARAGSTLVDLTAVAFSFRPRRPVTRSLLPVHCPYGGPDLPGPHRQRGKAVSPRSTRKSGSSRRGNLAGCTPAPCDLTEGTTETPHRPSHSRKVSAPADGPSQRFSAVPNGPVYLEALSRLFDLTSDRLASTGPDGAAFVAAT